MSTAYPTVGVASGLPRYSYSLRLLHWMIAVLLIMALMGGMTLGLLGYERLVELVGADMAGYAYMGHKTLGIVILGLMLLRLLVRVSQGTPGYAIDLTRTQHVVAGLVHFLLYVLVIAMPVIGWLATAAAGHPVNFGTYELPGFIAPDPELARTLFLAHTVVALCIMGLVVLHVSAAMYHARVRRDWVTTRISLMN
ncbi:cytochrome b561 [Ectothiorhodospira magna]|uniref:Cytochrome b561 n=1 Tax=Ectothiorhodospira magna TaxID=867345 RepID=A0A1H9C3C1_9GAMM|nr:cytochrome b/b6 domain-containing protein [Ectothiorhodospira magna]SEP95720.1 cytochrome b561 [Ectothiorhodospira magna]